MIRTAPALRGVDSAVSAVSTGATVAGTALSVTTAAASAGLLTLSATMAAAIPIAGAVIAVGTVIFSLLHNSRGLQQNVETTQIVNKAAEYMNQNLAAWNASTKNYATQAAALKNFDDAWQAVVNFCSQASEGDPGQRCISERKRGGKYDMFAALRDPIANDPDAGAPDRAAAQAAAEAAQTNPAAISQAIAASISGSSISEIVLPAALILLVITMSSK